MLEVSPEIRSDVIEFLASGDRERAINALRCRGGLSPENALAYVDVLLEERPEFQQNVNQTGMEMAIGGVIVVIILGLVVWAAWPSGAKKESPKPPTSISGLRAAPQSPETPSAHGRGESASGGFLSWMLAIGLPAVGGLAIAYALANIRRQANNPNWQECAYGVLAGWCVAAVVMWLGWAPASFNTIMWIGAWLACAMVIVSIFLSHRLEKQKSEESQAVGKWWENFAVACIVACAVLGWVAKTTGGSSDSSSGSSHGGKDGLTLQQLNLTSPIVMVQWSEDDKLAGTDRGAVQGSTCPIAVADGKLLLITNRHCLALDSLASADSLSDGKPEVASYEISVRFVTGTSRKVDRVRVPKTGLGGIDLAVLEVDARGLKPGVDFVLLQPFEVTTTTLTVGENTVAVGTPHGWEATHTFGRISQFRSDKEGKTTLVQTDAPINPGNSGGPLFIQRGDRYFWIGVNTFISGSDNLGFAIHSKHSLSTAMTTFDATKQGVVQLLNAFGYRAVVFP